MMSKTKCMAFHPQASIFMLLYIVMWSSFNFNKSLTWKSQHPLLPSWEVYFGNSIMSLYVAGKYFAGQRFWQRCQKTLCYRQNKENTLPKENTVPVCRRFVRKTYCQGDILSWIFDRRFVRKTFCQHVFCETFCQEDILSVQFFCGRILHRQIVRKTNCQDPFWPYF